MNQKKLLIFPKPTRLARTKRSIPVPPIRKPGKSTQSQRFGGAIANLTAVLDNQNVFIAPSVQGYQPEMVLVLEVAGSLDDFFKAVRRTDGMEFLAEFEGEFDPDQYFFHVDKKGNITPKRVENRIFLTMTNQRGLQELQRLWNEYQKPKGKYETGLTPFRDLFDQLRDIRTYGVADRFRDTGFESYLQEMVDFGETSLSFEIELVFHTDIVKQQKALELAQNLLFRQGGSVVEGSVFLMPEIRYHGFVASAPATAFSELSEDTSVAFLKCEQILFFRPVGQSVSTAPDARDIAPLSEPSNPLPLPSKENPIVALLDGFPLANHNLLAERVIVHDPDNIAPTYPANARTHGTSMASIVIHGELDKEETPLDRKIIAIPVMQSQVIAGRSNERLPTNKLVLDVIHRAVRQLKEGENSFPPAAPDVRIINLSLGDADRPFHSIPSSWAKLLDWLSLRYNLLFIISAGNLAIDFETESNQEDFLNKPDEERERQLYDFYYSANAERRVISPAESLNNMTVGAAHRDASPGNQHPMHRFDLAPEKVLSPISRIGFGIGGSIKPDILMPGGRVLFRKAPMNPRLFRIETTNCSPYPPGMKCALPGTNGEPGFVAYTTGTSNAAALATRLAAQLYETLLELNEEYPQQPIPEPFFPVLIKALLVHGARTEGFSENLHHVLSLKNHIAANNRRKYVSQFLGNGLVDGQRVLFCTDQRVTLLGFGELTQDSAHEFRFPLPAALSGRQLSKELAVSLAWLSPLSFSSRRYRIAQLDFETPQMPLSMETQDHKGTRGTVLHQVYVGERADVILEEDAAVIKINCKKDASDFQGRIRYGLAVTLSLRQETEIEIYEEIRTKVQQLIQIGI